MGFSVLTPLTLSSAMVFGDNIKNISWMFLYVLMIVSSYTWPKGCGMSQMGMLHHRVGHVFVQNELILLNISVFQVAPTLQGF